MGYAENDPASRRWISAFVQGLNDRGQVVGRTIEIDYRWATGNVQQMQSKAAELAALKPDVILVASTPALAAMQHETKSLPIVFVNVIAEMLPALVRPLPIGIGAPANAASYASMKVDE